MKSDHRTHLLFLEPEYPPSEKLVEDELTRQVDFIFSQLVQTEGRYRGRFCTDFGVCSDTSDYLHPAFGLVSNSLATYYSRHHRKDLSQKEMDWINELYNILKAPDAYYQITPKPVYFFKLYQKGNEGYGNAQTFAIRVIGSIEGVVNILTGVFFRELTEQEFNIEAKRAKKQFEYQSPGCEFITVYDVLKE